MHDLSVHNLMRHANTPHHPSAWLIIVVIIIIIAGVQHVLGGGQEAADDIHTLYAYSPRIGQEPA